IAKDIKDSDNNKDDIHSEKLPVLDDLPLPDTLPNIDDNYGNTSLKDDDLDISNISENLDDILKENGIEEEPKAEDKKEEPEPLPVDDDLGLDNLLSETSVDEEEPKAEDKKEEPVSAKDDDIDLDNLSLDDTEEEPKAESKKEEPVSAKDDDIDLDNLSLDDTEEEPKAEDKKEELLPDLDDLSKELEEQGDKPSSNIIEGGTTLPPPETADNLPASKYEDVDKDIDQDKVINVIKHLSPLTQYHVLDTILNEKIDKDSMETLLNALERGESNEAITDLLNKELGLGIKEEGRKNVIDLIPIPNSLKDYARIIRVAAIFLVLFVAIVLLSFQFIYKPVMANKYYNMGLTSISNGAYDEAERNFAEGERLRPKQIKWYNKYARAYIARETFNEAFTKIQGALNLKPRDFETRITFGYYYRKKGEKELSEEDYVLGEELYNDMLVYTEKKKEKQNIYDERGLLMISRARNMSEPEYYDIAYTNYSDMVNFFGDGVVPRKRAMLIKIYQDNYKHVKALQDHIELLKPGYIDDEVYPKLAQYLLDKEDFYGSRVLFEKLLSTYPNNLESVVGYADYETRLKHYDRAMEILNTAALPLYESNPFYKGKEYVYNMLGQIYYNLGEYGNAVRNFNEALAINKVYPDANYNLGNVYFYKDKDYAKAKEYYQMAYDNLPPSLRSDQLLYNLSWIYYSDEEYDSAFEGFNALFQKNPSNSVVSYALGNSLLHLDKANLANGFYRNALSQVLAKRNSLGELEMRTERDFILISYLASLYNNIGVSYAYNSTITNTIVNEQQAFKHFVLASEYFDQIRTSNVDLEKAEKRTVLVEDQNIGAATYNIMSMQAKRNLKEATVIDDYIPKDMYYVR
ncbi:tetratricopeptide repeat protein, partial [Brachyspira pulli]|uniref:periplasmic flagellar collar protein FlcA n=1 Tax=Brachyspira pulli TaxID=310721 RepID=UPI003003DF97